MPNNKLWKKGLVGAIIVLFIGIAFASSINADKVIYKTDFEKICLNDSDLVCWGELNWTNVEPGETVYGRFTIRNAGKIDTLYWEISEWPEWGIWDFGSFFPKLIPGDHWIVFVNMTAPNQGNKTFTGHVKVVNKNNASDFGIINASLTTSTIFGYNIKTSIIRKDGNTLYVGGSGSGNYTRIQDAIDNATNGDTVFVYAFSSPYYENVVVDKSIRFIGEDKNTTVIDGGGSRDVVKVTADWVKISNFTIRNSPEHHGISLHSDNNTITNCILYNLRNGIYVYSDNNSIINCKCYNNYVGININTGKNNEISSCRCYLNDYAGISVNNHGDNNKITKCYIHSNINTGISFTHADKNIINRCNISGNENGIWLSSDANIIFWCDFYNNNATGISARHSTVNNRIERNNFIRNTINAEDYSNNSWSGYSGHGCNYWSDYTGDDYYRGFNQSIPGSDGIGDTPYNISGPGNNTDKYPLMSPWGSPFQTLYLGDMEVLFRRISGGGSGGHKGGYKKGIYLNVNSSLEELPLTIVYHYTVEMNYSLKFPFWFAPLFAIGLKIRNYSDYKWKSMKLLNHGYGIWYGNVTQKIILNLTGFEKDDELDLYIDIPVITAPLFFDSPGHNESWMLLLRIVYNIPALKDVLLHNWLLPILAPYNLMFDSKDYPSIYLRFK